MNSEFELVRNVFHFDEGTFARVLGSARSAAFAGR
jgi:hypothetical protein